MKARRLTPVTARQLVVFKIKNRRGYAAICLHHLTEGRTAAQAVARLVHPLRRVGRSLPRRLPACR